MDSFHELLEIETEESRVLPFRLDRVPEPSTPRELTEEELKENEEVLVHIEALHRARYVFHGFPPLTGRAVMRPIRRRR